MEQLQRVYVPQFLSPSTSGNWFVSVNLNTILITIIMFSSMLIKGICICKYGTYVTANGLQTK